MYLSNLTPHCMAVNKVFSKVVALFYKRPLGISMFFTYLDPGVLQGTDFSENQLIIQPTELIILSTYSIGCIYNQWQN